VTDEEKARGRGRGATGTPVAVQAGATAPTALVASAAPLDPDDSDNRTKVPVAWALANGERVLGLPGRELVAALGERDPEEEMTLNAVRKAVSEWREQVQNPDAAEEA
jgi:hypothetical protein